MLDALNFRLGKFYVPFGYELREYPFPIRKLVTRPLMARNLLFDEWVDAGIQVYGGLNLPVNALKVNYEVAVINGPNEKEDSEDTDAIPEILEVGTGANPDTGGTKDALQNHDNNFNRTVVGRLSVPVLEEMGSIGISFAKGRYSNSNNPELNFSLYGVDGNVYLKKFNVRGQWVKRTIDLTTSTQRDSYSYYLQASYKKIFDKPWLYFLEPAVRYDFLDPGDSTNTFGKRQRFSAAFHYSPYPHFKLGAEWQWNGEERSERQDNGFLLNAVADF
ncbi:MAG: hypothetical protein HY559_00600 [Gammaproteobacteria bacterium]|nr:hypothetical protein [Gammaproteobacteria bacterium]